MALVIAWKTSRVEPSRLLGRCFGLHIRSFSRLLRTLLISPIRIVSVLRSSWCIHVCSSFLSLLVYSASKMSVILRVILPSLWLLLLFISSQPILADTTSHDIQKPSSWHQACSNHPDFHAHQARSLEHRIEQLKTLRQARDLVSGVCRKCLPLPFGVRCLYVPCNNDSEEAIAESTPALDVKEGTINKRELEDLPRASSTLTEGCTWCNILIGSCKIIPCRRNIKKTSDESSPNPVTSKDTVNKRELEDLPGASGTLTGGCKWCNMLTARCKVIPCRRSSEMITDSVIEPDMNNEAIDKRGLDDTQVCDIGDISECHICYQRDERDGKYHGHFDCYPTPCYYGPESDSAVPESSANDEPVNKRERDDLKTRDLATGECTYCIPHTHKCIPVPCMHHLSKEATADVAADASIEKEAIRKRGWDDLRHWMSIPHDKTNSSHPNLGTNANDLFAPLASTACALSREVGVGPHYLPRDLLRSNITEGQPGIPVHLVYEVIDTQTCRPLAEAWVDTWSANATGVYAAFVHEGNGNPADASNVVSHYRTPQYPRASLHDESTQPTTHCYYC